MNKLSFLGAAQAVVGSKSLVETDGARARGLRPLQAVPGIFDAMVRWVHTSPIVAFSLALTIASGAAAQCTSGASSCLSCHETQGGHPVLQGSQAWHVDHAFGDLCAACHGGDVEASEKAQAHTGLRSPLADPSVSCKGCHEHEYLDFADGYSTSSFAITPRAREPASRAAGPSPRIDSVLAGLAALLAAVLAVVLRPELRRVSEWPRRAVRALRQKRWSPRAAGAALGVLVAVSELSWRRPLAAAGAFDKLAAYAGRRIFPSSTYYLYVMTPGITWQVWLMVGVLVGSFASSKLAGEARLRWMPDAQWISCFGASRARRLALAFAGAMLVQIGAGIAGGCTSGLAISGGTVLAPAAFLFMAGMFAGGIPTARLWYRARRGAGR